jgi:hypothetical protein
VTLLADFEDFFECHCGVPLAVVSEFALAPGSPRQVTLTSLQALDARRPELPSAVDFADAERFARFDGDLSAWSNQVKALGAQDLATRERLLRSALTAFSMRAEPSSPPDPWTRVIGPMRCSACGRVAQRTIHTLFTHCYLPESFFGRSWTGGVIEMGARVAVDSAALEDGSDRGAYARLRPPAGRGELVILDGKTNWGCQCGAGRVSPCLHFTFAPGELVLASLEARYVHDASDLDDVEFALAPWATGALAPPSDPPFQPSPDVLDRDARVRRILLE